MLKIATISYGASLYPVRPNEVSPLPAEFDFSDAEACARRIFAIMSNASGGHTLRGCKVRIHAERQTANLTANGCHVFYAPEQRQPLTPEEAVRAMDECQTVELGNVTTDQYGEGWKRARWTRWAK
jgi:hypothetical protein